MRTSGRVAQGLLQRASATSVSFGERPQASTLPSGCLRREHGGVVPVLLLVPRLLVPSQGAAGGKGEITYDVGAPHFSIR